MKKIFTLLCFTLVANGYICAQLNTNTYHIYGKTSIGVIDTAFYSSYGLSAEIFANKKLSFNYNFDYTLRKDNVTQLHTPMGLVGGPILMAIGLGNAADADTTTSGAFGVLGGLLLLVLPDGVSYHQNVGYRGDISPYANLLGIDFIHNRTLHERKIKYACSFGVRGTYVVAEHFTFSAFAETRKTASIPWGFGGGIGIGYTFKKKENSEGANP